MAFLSMAVWDDNARAWRDEEVNHRNIERVRELAADHPLWESGGRGELFMVSGAVIVTKRTAAVVRELAARVK